MNTVLRSVLISLLFCSLLSAEGAKRGRLPDGTAFRTDAQGMELVDYTAELEVRIDELERRLHGMQYEVEEKEDIIAALKKQGAKEPTVKERDLLVSKTAQEMLDQPISESGQDNRITALRSQLKSLEKQNIKLQEQLLVKTSLAESYQRQLSGTEGAKGSEEQINSLQKEIQSLRSELEQARSNRLHPRIGGRNLVNNFFQRHIFYR